MAEQTRRTAQADPEPPSTQATDSPRVRAAQISNETVEGGAYMVNGRLVDANGEPVKDKKD